MLNSLEPIIIFQFRKKVDPTFIGPQEQPLVDRIPLLSKVPTFIDEPPIPIYLMESITGLYIADETKTVDANTDMETKTDGSAPNVQQKAIGSSVKIELDANQNSIGVTLLSALIDLALDKLTSNEYSITYLHGAVTIFRGLIHSYSVVQDSNTDKYRISIELSAGSDKKPKAPEGPPEVKKITGLVPL